MPTDKKKPPSAANPGRTTPKQKGGPPADGNRRIVDLDAARAARAEKRGDPPAVKLGGRLYDLPHEPPASIVFVLGELGSLALPDDDDPDHKPMTEEQLMGMAAEKLRESITDLLGAEVAGEVLPQLTVPDLWATFEGLVGAYDLSPPES